MNLAMSKKIILQTNFRQYSVYFTVSILLNIQPTNRLFFNEKGWMVFMHINNYENVPKHSVYSECPVVNVPPSTVILICSQPYAPRNVLQTLPIT